MRANSQTDSLGIFFCVSFFLKKRMQDYEESIVDFHLLRCVADVFVRPSASFDYMTVVYNVKIKEGQEPKLLFQSTLFKDGQIYSKTGPEDINMDGMGDLGRIPIVKKLVFDDKMEDGDYLLQLTVTDKPPSEKSRSAWRSRIAVQAMDFQIRK
jgi:hypothetical protein